MCQNITAGLVATNTDSPFEVKEDDISVRNSSIGKNRERLKKTWYKYKNESII